MSKITAYNPLTIPQGDDIVPIVDIHDTSMAASGTTKKVTIANLMPDGWLNVLSYGADPSGTNDSTAAIRAALSAAPLGGTVSVPAAYWNGLAWAQATYKTTSPLVIPPGVTLMSQGQSLAYYGGSTVMPLSSAIIKPAATFATSTIDTQVVAGVFVMVSQTLGSYSTGSGNQAIKGITIDGRSAPAGTNGIEAWGPVWGVKLEDVGIYGLPNFGVATSTSTPDGTGKAPDLWKSIGIHIAACGSDGWNVVGGLSDSYFVACESTGNTGNGWNMTGGNTRWVGCKAEFNILHGWNLLAAGGAGTGTQGVWLEGCDTDHNGQDGINVFGARLGPVCLDGCSLHGDGYQAGSGGGGFAGLRVNGSCTAYVIATGLRVNTVSGTTPFPQYGIRTDGVSPSVVQVGGAGLIYGNTAATNVTSTGTIHLGTDVLTGTGAWGT